MKKLAQGLLFYLCAVYLLSAQEPTPTPAPTPTATPAAKAPVSLDPIMQMDLRTVTLPEFVAGNRNVGFRWLSATHDAAQNTEKGLTLFQIPVYQVVVRFDGEKVKEITFSFYNRGDSGESTREQFEALKQRSAQAITNFTNVKPVERGKDPTNAVKAEGIIWQTDKTQFLLESSASRAEEGYRAEFVRLTVTPAEKPKSLIEESLAASHPVKFSAADHLKNMPNGDVLLDGIPMVDQGEKGYCVVASAERVIRYYGGKADANELAQIANSSAEEGTSPTAMFNSLKKLSNRLHVKIRALEEFNAQRFESIFNDYDKVAKRGQRAPEINPNVRTLSEVFEQMDPDVLIEARTKNPSDMNRFFRTVQAHIAQGIPPLWSVMIGVIPHAKNSAGYGGHMRLIIGYNLKTNEILYSDSWGYGHELSRMPLTDAWTITTGLHSIEPL